MPDEFSPASVTEAPQVTAVETPAALTEAPAQTATTEAPESTKPDYKSLAEQLARDPEGRKYLLEHPEIKGELDHRVKSVRRADVDREVEQRLAAIEAQRTQRDLESELATFVKEYPEHPLAQKVKPVLDAQSAAEQRNHMQVDIVRQAGNAWKGALVNEVKADDALTDEDKAFLDPFNVERFASNAAFVKEWRQRAATNEAKKEIAKLLPSEREAIKQQVLAELRGESPSPANLPQGSAATSDAAFLDAYGRGDVSDHARAKRLLGMT